MRRSYISPEYTTSEINGTFNMNEESTFFGSKMLNIEDHIYVSNQNIIYYQKENSEQIDISVESSTKPIIYSSSDSKFLNSTLSIDESQIDSQKDENTKWILTINIEKILEDYIFSSLKKSRVFEGIYNNKTISNDVNSSIYEYISNNVSNRYKYTNTDMYIKYTDLRKDNIFRFKNKWDADIFDANYIFKKTKQEISENNKNVKIIFSQEKSSKLYNFNYYYNILFEKI